MRRLTLVTIGALTIAAVVIVAAMVIQDRDERTPQDVLTEVVEAINLNDTDSLVECSVYHFASQQKKDDAIDLNNKIFFRFTWNWTVLNVSQERYLVDMNDNERTKVREYVNSFLAAWGFNLTIDDSDCCILSFNVTVTNMDLDVSGIEPISWVLVEVEDDWYLLGKGILYTNF